LSRFPRFRYVLAVNDLALSTAFYRDVLGFEDEGVDAEGWAFLRRGDWHMMLGECPDETPALETGNHSYFAYIETDDVDALHEEFSAGGAEIIGIVTDVRSLESVQALADATLGAFGAVHILCNNAGVGTNEMGDTIWTSRDNDWKWCFEVNVWGVLHGIKAFVPGMLERGEEGHVINTSSGNGGLYPLPTTPVLIARS